MGDPTQITMVLGPDGPVTGEHPVCGATWEPPGEVGPMESIHEAACWAAEHRDCRCLADRTVPGFPGGDGRAL